MTDDFDIQRFLGGIEARTMILEHRVATLENEIRDELKSMGARIDTVHDAIVSARGSWKAVAWLVGASSVIAGAVGAFFHWVLPR